MKNLIRRKPVALTAIILFVCQLTMAQGSPNKELRPRAGDPIAENFFLPELIMHHQKAIKLTDEQRKFIIEKVRETENNFTELQWSLQKEMETFEEIISAERVDPDKALEQLKKILEKESAIKKSRILLLITIKNKLNTEQQELLRKLR